MLLLSYFQDFDRGGTGLAASDEDLEIGETVQWECGQFHGFAKVVSKQGGFYELKKL